MDGDSEMKTYLNGTYYDSITKNKTAIQNHLFYYGGAEYYNDDLANQIETEKEFSAASNVGLISASDFLKANSNTSLCGTFSKSKSNYETCKPTNYMVNWMGSSGYYWTITLYSNTGNANSTCDVLTVNYDGSIKSSNAYGSNPYTITNYVE